MATDHQQPNGTVVSVRAAPEVVAEPGDVGVDAHRPRPVPRGGRSSALALLVYAVLALAAYWPIWPGDPGRIPGCACGDQAEQVWFLSWTPLALLHGHNPFVTGFVDYPTGVNMAVNTLMPGLGLLGTPVTVLWGGVATLNLFLWLSFPLSAAACFVLLRRWVRWTPAAFVGGLLYGFSPYAAGQGAGHLHLLFVPLPPLVLLLLDEVLVRQRARPWLAGGALGLAAAAEYLVSAEVFGSTLALAVVGTALVVAARPGRLAGHLRHAAAAVATAGAVCLLLVGYPVWLELAGPHRFTGSAHGSYPFAADLLGLVVPSVHQLVAPAQMVAVSNRFILGDVTENGSYLGIPLLVLVAVVVVGRWRRPLVRFAAAMAVAAELLALGPTLTVDGRSTGVPLPDRLLDHLPLFASFVDARFSLYVDLFVAVLLAVAVDELHRTWTAPGRRVVADDAPRRHRMAELRRRRRRWVAPAGLAGTLAVVLVPLLPNWPYPSVPVTVPPLFTSAGDAAALDRVPVGTVALTYPYTDPASDQGLLWQAASGARFRLLGGYFLVPGPTGAASFDAFPPALDDVPATLAADDQGTTPGAVVPGATAASPADVRRFLRHYRVATVLADPVGARPQQALRLLRAALGAPTAVGGLDVWFDVPRVLNRR
ncbi:MAG: hypothetical protein ACYCU7_12825 [Acidimicrobiales bacterium]